MKNKDKKPRNENVENFVESVGDDDKLKKSEIGKSCCKKDKIGIGCKIKNKMIKFFHQFEMALFPPNVTCDVCHNELIWETRLNLCSECVASMPFNNKKICLKCGTQIEDESDYCLRCQNTLMVFDKARSPLVYEGLAKKIVYELKVGKKKYLIDLLSKMMADTYIEEKFDADVVTFVPMTKKEEKVRGFNQSKLLAYALAKRLNLPVEEAIQKVRETQSQKKLSAKERAKNLEDAFRVYDGFGKGKNVLLVDDVLTTGATANECSKMLAKTKPKKIYVLTCACTKQKIAL